MYFCLKQKKYMDYSNKTYKELVKEEDELKEEFNLMLDSCAKEGLSFLEFCDRAKDIKEKLYFVSKYKRLKQTPTVEYGKEWRGDIFTLEKFIEIVNDGGFVDSDGYGYYATEDAKSDVYIYPSDIKEKLYRSDFTHIIWFNN